MTALLCVHSLLRSLGGKSLTAMSHKVLRTHHEHKSVLTFLFAEMTVLVHLNG